MSASGQLRQCLRMLLLPMRAGHEVGCARALLRELRELHIAPADFRSWVDLNTGLWRESGEPTEQLRKVVTVVLQTANDKVVEGFATAYFNIHFQLMSDHLMSHEEARAFLSNAFLMADLASLEMLSAAQIAKLLSRRDARVQFSRQSVATMLGGIGLAPILTKERVERLHLRDANLELAVFADADLETAAEIVDSTGASLGFPEQIIDSLRVLAPTSDLAAFIPYLQVLHYQCTIAEFFDHAVTDMYEFSPRGVAAKWLFEQYPDFLADAGNPFLNNLKSVGTIDASWVRSKKQKERPGANALLQILSGLEAMGFAARRELGKLLRLWIHRVLRLSQPLAIVLPEKLSEPQLIRLLACLAEGNTRTFGVIEQRAVDSISEALHPPHAGWRNRGLSDSVNATNISRRKIGDCDFQHSLNRFIEAYEAHGGELTDVYVDDHLRTLRKVMVLRAVELSGIDDLAKWNISINFVAHKLSITARPPIMIEGITVYLRFTTFKEFLTTVPLGAPNWTDLLIAPLKERRTPKEARKALLTIIGT